MQNITVREGQTALDIAMQYCGDATQAFAIANANGSSVTDDLTLGASLSAPDADTSVQYIVNEFEENNLIPASAVTADVDAGGIGYWVIEQDFIIS